jgi:hypothetical protein
LAIIEPALTLNNHRKRIMVLRIVMAALLCSSMLHLAACRRPVAEGPETVPVRGKVVFTKGGNVKDLCDHSIFVQFQSIEQPGVLATGEILEDGTFTLATEVGKKGKPGAIRGAHRVRLNADEAAARFVAPRFLNYETSGIQVTVPSDNVLEIKVWR